MFVNKMNSFFKNQMVRNWVRYIRGRRSVMIPVGTQINTSTVMHETSRYIWTLADIPEAELRELLGEWCEMYPPET